MESREDLDGEWDDVVKSRNNFILDGVIWEVYKLWIMNDFPQISQDEVSKVIQRIVD
jgi:hypothetical protein